MSQLTFNLTRIHELNKSNLIKSIFKKIKFFQFNSDYSNHVDISK